MEIAEIVKCLQDMRNNVIKKDHTDSAKELLFWLSGSKNWADEQCRDFYESILKRYIVDDAEALELMLAVSGLLEGYRQQTWSAARRRREYVTYLAAKNPDSDQRAPNEEALVKREKELIKIVADSLKKDFDSGAISINQCTATIEDIGIQPEIPNETPATTKPSNTEEDASQRLMTEKESQGKKAKKISKKKVNKSNNYITKIGALLKINKTVNYNIYDSFNQSQKNAPVGAKHPVLKKFICIMLACLVTLYIVCTYIHFGPGSDADAKNTGEMVEHTQNRIVNLDDPLADVIGPAYEEVLSEIMRNPVMGDMFACGLRDLKIDDARTFGDIYPWINEFISKTDAAMAIPINQHPRGIEIWIEYRNNELHVTEEYRLYAAKICLILNAMTIVGVREWESVENWHLPEGEYDSNSRTERNPDQVSYPAIILQFSDNDGNPIALIGICVYDQRLMVYDPELLLT